MGQAEPIASTRHIRLRLPQGQRYDTGDHIAVYARNRPDLVARALARLGVDGATIVEVAGQGTRFRHLPVGRSVTVAQLLRDFVELSDPVSRRAVTALARETRCPDTRAKLAAIDDAAFEALVATRTTLLDLLDAYPAAELSLDALVELSAPIAPRFYSVASSPLVSPDIADLLVGTTVAPAWSGLGEHRGFASGYMAGIAPGTEVFGYVRHPNPPFAPPEDAAVPMILIAASTGLAPFRGFLQERARQRAEGGEVAASLLFFGCRHPDHDWLCRDEMERWQADGVAEPFLAFSRMPSHPWPYVQDAVWAEQERVWAALRAGASIYLCGDGRRMAPAVRDTLIRIQMQQAGDAHAQGSEWLNALIDEGRFHQDVFGFGK